MKYRFYANSERAWNAMRDAIANAKESIYWESYIFIDDALGRAFLDLLKARAAAGVRVKLILDSVGSFQMFSSFAGELASRGVEVLYFNRLLPWWNPARLRMGFFMRTHRKLLVIDGKMGFVGGVNIGGKYRRWHDLQLEVRGNVVRSFTRSFAKSYRICGGADRINIPPRVLTGMDVAFLDHWPARRKNILKKYYKAACVSARTRIVIATPYFVPHYWLMKLLRQAARRGIAVEVILPQSTDIRLLDLANKVFAGLGVRAGLRFFFVPEMIHAKALLIDEREGMVGSMNIDARSFDYNVESSVAFRDEGMVKDLRGVLEHWKSVAKPYAPPTPRRWYHAALELLFKLAQPIL